MLQHIERFLDEDGKLKAWPAKRSAQGDVLTYLAGKFEYDRNYTEHEINAILASWHTFGDFFLLRRELVEHGWLVRLKNGSRYWKNPDKQEENT